MRKRKNKNWHRRGFTLIETLVYIAVFAIVATFLVMIFDVVGRIQNKQGSANEVNQQISFVGNTVSRLVKESSLVENAAGESSSSLILRMPQTALDPTRIFLENEAIYLKQGAESAVSLTDENVSVQDFSVVKYENPGGPSVVQVDLTLSYNSDNPQAQTTRKARTAITRISAATFDSSILPTGGNFSIGQAAAPSWGRIFLSRGSQTTPSYTFTGDTDLGFYSSGNDNIAIVTGGVERIKIDANGEISFSSISDDDNGKLVCIKNGGALGTCSNQPNNGLCGCN